MTRPDGWTPVKRARRWATVLQNGLMGYWDGREPCAAPVFHQTIEPFMSRFRDFCLNPDHTDAMIRKERLIVHQQAAQALRAEAASRGWSV